MEKDWVKVFDASQEYQAEMAKEILEDNEIQAVILNKHDSSYVTIGYIEVYVHKDNEDKALEILKELSN